MLRLPKTARVFVWPRPINLRSGVDRLVQIVRADLGVEAFTDQIFCFFSADRDQVKLLVWDRNGFWMLSKRLEQGRFETLDTRVRLMEISREQLVMLLSGIDIRTKKFLPHFVRDVRIDRRDDERARSAE